MSTATLIQESRPAQGGVYSYISPSRLNSWIRCPLSWKLHYIDGLRTPTTPSLFVGQIVHSALEELYRHRMLGLALSEEELERRMLDGWAQAIDESEMKFADSAEEQASQRQAIDLVKAYVRQLPADEPKPLAVEVTLESPLVDPATGEDLGVPLLGVIDLVLGGQEGAQVVDFKTSSKSAMPHEITHEIQLTAYSWLFRQAQGVEEAGLEIRSLVKTKTPKIESHCYAPRSDAHFGRFFALIREYLDCLDRGVFNYRPGFACSMCDHRDRACRGWCG